MTEQSIIVTASAVAKIDELIREEQDLALKLRVYISGGGCSGFQYNFMFDKTIAADDEAITTTNEQVTIVIDVMSYQYLRGAEIDYVEDLSGAQFIIRNPNAKTTCGCGSSFAI